MAGPVLRDRLYFTLQQSLAPPCSCRANTGRVRRSLSRRCLPPGTPHPDPDTLDALNEQLGVEVVSLVWWFEARAKRGHKVGLCSFD
jgi:hypothetical protein